ncbi:MAG: hypothetical protein EKK54_00085 [Neisseriaceae bacterium]|nr:MAG: hypothetical protein EKK54_00085 [Neisseriaceae bacterium]
MSRNERDYKDSLFDSLGVANKEKIHTQFLSWFFNSANINNGIKIKFLSKILDNQPIDEANNSEITAITEYESIDLIIIIKDKNFCIQCIFAFENKLKSTLHSNQLAEYYKVLNNKFNNINTHKFLLSLIEEPKPDEWNSLLYEKLLEIFEDKDLLDQINGDDKVFITEYIKTLNNLLLAKSEFFKRPDDFKDVLVVKKSDLNKYTELSNLSDNHCVFVAKYQLGTIFMMNFIREKFKDIIKSKKYEFKETHGHPLLDIVLIEYDKYILQFQYQNLTVKLQLISIGGAALSECLISKFKSLKDVIGYEKINEAKNNKKNYISLSKKIEENYSELGINVLTEFDYINNKVKKIETSLEL